MSRVEEIFDPTRFRHYGHELIDLLADYLAASLARQGKVLDWKAPALEDAQWQAPLPRGATLSPDQLLEKLRTDILPAGLAIHHPRNLGHQVATPLPMAALCDLVAALTNQAMAVYEAGPAATLIERQVIRWLAELIGRDHAEGVLTSGGAQANLTALLAARQQTAGWDIWKEGAAAGPPLCILASEHAHYSVSRAAGIMGLGVDAVVKVAADPQGRMEPAALAASHRQAIASGARVMAVVATAGCTPTGSVDPLAAIGTYCREHGLWLHVDGAHGASALLSTRHRDAMRGIGLADSVVWDGHKLLYMPAPVSAVLFREPKTSYAAFAQEASYLFQGQSNEEEAYNVGYRTLECTKRMMGLKLWAAFSLYGTEGLGELVDKVFASARLLADKLQAAPDFELLMPPQTNIVCFRYRNGDQAAIRKALVESGAFHLTQVNLHGEVWLRTTVMNPLTAESDLDALLETIRHDAQLSSEAC
ncbi:MAG TPA: aminotransferase class V-fold PLP-dependent enzyme [Methylophilaceae bacterium]|nr:aminotransferase class V-fold PLP-dependent enzyme [Methylophilaceae bacterium]